MIIAAAAAAACDIAGIGKTLAIAGGTGTVDDDHTRGCRLCRVAAVVIHAC